MLSPEDIAELVQLRLRALEKHPGVDPAESVPIVLGELWADLASRGGSALLRSKKRIGAGLVWGSVERGALGIPATQVELVRDKRFRSAPRWVLEKLPEGDDLELMLDAADADLVEGLVGRGLYVDLAVHAGSPATALERCSEGPDLEELGLRVKKLETGMEVFAVMAILAMELRSNPRYAWFAAHPEYLNERQRELEANLEDEAETDRVLMDQDAIVGFLSYRIRDPDPLWGRSARTEIFLASSLRGRGVTRSAYQRLHRDLLDREVKMVVGGTSHPAMLHMYRVWGRRPFAYLLRSGTEHTPWDELVD